MSSLGGRRNDWAQEIAALEARVLRRVANALRAGYQAAWRGHGGPQDGPDSPSEFDAPRAAAILEDAADEVTKA